jgi:DNA gyrase/topoisomerase IV subunit B
MRDPQDAIINKTSDNPKEFTRITFIPDLKRFQMDKFDDDLVALFKRRAYDVAISTGCKVTLNGKRIPVIVLSFFNTRKLVLIFLNR